MSTESPNTDMLAWGLEHLLERKPEDTGRVDDFLVAVEDALQGALAARLAEVCAAMGVPAAADAEVLTDFELPPAGPEGDWAEAAALVDLGKGELHLALELYRVLEDDVPAGQAAFLAVRLLPGEAWDEDELADLAALLAENAEDADDDAAEEAAPAEAEAAGDADDDLDDEGEDLALIAELGPEDAPRLAEVAAELLDAWIEAWQSVRGR